MRTSRAITAKQGSPAALYARSGDSNRVLAENEIDAFVRNKRRSVDDEAPVDGSSTADLDHQLVDAFVRNLRATKPSTADLDDDAILLKEALLRRTGGSR